MSLLKSFFREFLSICKAIRHNYVTNLSASLRNAYRVQIWLTARSSQRMNKRRLPSRFRTHWLSFRWSRWPQLVVSINQLQLHVVRWSVAQDSHSVFLHNVPKIDREARYSITCRKSWMKNVRFARIDFFKQKPVWKKQMFIPMRIRPEAGPCGATFFT